jgi:hypothetical protein
MAFVPSYYQSLMLSFIRRAQHAGYGSISSATLISDVCTWRAGTFGGWHNMRPPQDTEAVTAALADLIANGQVPPGFVI